MTKLPKLLSIIALTSFTLCAPAHACDTVDHQVTIFGGASLDTGQDIPNNVFVGEITLGEKPAWFFQKRDLREGFNGHVHKSPSHPHLEGQSIHVETILGTSCGPYMRDGDRGVVAADIISADGEPLRIRPRVRSATPFAELQQYLADKASKQSDQQLMQTH